MRKQILIAILIFSGSALFSQGSVSDTPLRMSLFQFQGGAHQPFGDMGDKYGTSAAVGFSYAYKTAKNFLFGADFNYIFGNNVNDANDIYHGLRLSNGKVVGINEEFINALILQRGYATGFYVGKIFGGIGQNPNSGIVVKIGLEYLEHRTYIETRQDDYAPLEGDYLKNYDRKIAGLALYEFIGYQHFSNSRYANFFAGFDFYQGFTSDYRSYNVDLMQKTDNDYLDILIGFRVGWVIPVYKQAGNKFYFN